jgi:glutaredoxin
MSIKISIYGKKDCPWTTKTIDWFESKGITKYNFFDVTSDLKARDELFRKTGSYAYPVTFLDKKVVEGYDKSGLQKGLFS